MSEANRRILTLRRKEDGKSRKRYKPEQIIDLPRGAGVHAVGVDLSTL